MLQLTYAYLINLTCHAPSSNFSQQIANLLLSSNDQIVPVLKRLNLGAVVRVNDELSEVCIKEPVVCNAILAYGEQMQWKVDEIFYRCWQKRPKTRVPFYRRWSL